MMKVKLAETEFGDMKITQFVVSVVLHKIFSKIFLNSLRFAVLEQKFDVVHWFHDSLHEPIGAGDWAALDTRHVEEDDVVASDDVGNAVTVTWHRPEASARTAKVRIDL